MLFRIFNTVADPHHRDADPYVMRIRILLFTLTRIRILPFTSMQILIQLYNLDADPDPQHCQRHKPVGVKKSFLKRCRT
jgi:hypothetical protein